MQLGGAAAWPDEMKIKVFFQLEENKPDQAGSQWSVTVIHEGTKKQLWVQTTTHTAVTLTGTVPEQKKRVLR